MGSGVRDGVARFAQQDEPKWRRQVKRAGRLPASPIAPFQLHIRHGLVPNL